METAMPPVFGKEFFVSEHSGHRGRPTRLPAPASGGRPLTDNYGRTITYLRLAVTDRCNLRCRYCMPPSGMDFVPHQEILRFEEMENLV